MLGSGLYQASSSILRQRYPVYSFADLHTSEDCPESGHRGPPQREGSWAEETMIVAAGLDHGLRGTVP